MYSIVAASLLKALIISTLFEAARAQTYSSCNPLVQSGCPADTALGKSVDIDFTSGSSSEFTASGDPTYDSNGAAFTISKSGDAPSISSNWYIMFGHVDYVIKAAPGTGIVSAAVLQSDCLDEIDWEWLGGDNTQAQSNYFGKGITTTGYNRGAFHAADDNHDTFHTYSIDWTADQIVWSIDGTTVRAMTQEQAESGQYPQTPMYVKLGAWAGGDPSNPQGTINWAGGVTDYSAGPFTMYVKSVHVTDYSTGSQYSYSGTNGTWESIVSDGGQINGEGDGTPVSTVEAPAVTSHVSNSAPLAFGNGDNTASVTATRTGWPWSGTATATAVTIPQSHFSLSAQASSLASESASLEVITSYNGQGFPTIVTINPAAPTVKSYDSQGFLITSLYAPESFASSTTTELGTPTGAAESGYITISSPPETTSTEAQTFGPSSAVGTTGGTITQNTGGATSSSTESRTINSAQTQSFTMPSPTLESANTAGLTFTGSDITPSSTTKSGTTQVSGTSLTAPTTSATAISLNSATAHTTLSSVVPTPATQSQSTSTAVPSEQITTLRTSSSPSRTQSQSGLSTSTGIPPAVNFATASHAGSCLAMISGLLVGLVLI